MNTQPQYPTTMDTDTIIKIYSDRRKKISPVQVFMIMDEMRGYRERAWELLQSFKSRAQVWTQEFQEWADPGRGSWWNWMSVSHAEGIAKEWENLYWFKSPLGPNVASSAKGWEEARAYEYDQYAKLVSMVNRYRHLREEAWRGVVIDRVSQIPKEEETYWLGLSDAFRFVWPTPSERELWGDFRNRLETRSYRRDQLVREIQRLQDQLAKLDSKS